MSKPNDYDTYIIPPNFIEGGTFFGGLLKLRNTAEALVTHLPLCHGIYLRRLPLADGGK